jgi:hypothetical protein
VALSTSLISYWELNEASGDRVDAHGTNDLVEQNSGIASTTGKVSSAVLLDRSEGEFLSIADNADLSTGDIDFTFCTWVYANTAAGYIAAKCDGAPQNEWALDSSGTSDAYRFYVSANGSSFTVLSSAVTSALSTWRFIVAWHDSVANTINIQVDDGTPDSTAHSTGVYDGTSNFNLGNRETAFTTECWNGRLDQAGFWKRVLTSGERTTLYNGGAGLSYAGVLAGGATSARSKVNSLAGHSILLGGLVA